MKGALRDTEAQVSYEREIGDEVFLVGFKWGGGSSRTMRDFDIEEIGEINEDDVAIGEDIERQVGWVIYNKFYGEKGHIIELKENN